jgi:hypothetical protein
MMTDTNIETTAGGLVPLTDDELAQVGGGVLPIIAAVGAWAAANSTFLVCAGAGAGVVLGFWYCAANYRNN